MSTPTDPQRAAYLEGLKRGYHAAAEALEADFPHSNEDGGITTLARHLRAVAPEPDEATGEVWVLTLDRYRRDNLLALLEAGGAGGREPLYPLANTGDWFGELHAALAPGPEARPNLAYERHAALAAALRDQRDAERRHEGFRDGLERAATFLKRMDPGPGRIGAAVKVLLERAGTDLVAALGAPSRDAN